MEYATAIEPGTRPLIKWLLRGWSERQHPRSKSLIRLLGSGFSGRGGGGGGPLNRVGLRFVQEVLEVKGLGLQA